MQQYSFEEAKFLFMKTILVYSTLTVFTILFEIGIFLCFDGEDINSNFVSIFKSIITGLIMFYYLHLFNNTKKSAPYTKEQLENGFKKDFGRFIAVLITQLAIVVLTALVFAEKFAEIRANSATIPL